MKTRLLKVEICYEHDVVLSRQRARQIAELLGFDSQDQVRIATAVSEIARNTFRYAGRGEVNFLIVIEPQPVLQVILSDRGLGIAHLETILEGKYISKTGMGLGIIGAKRLMDRFQIDSNSTGTTVVLEKFIPNRTSEFTGAFFTHLANELSQQTSEEPFVELQQQNQELLAAFSELERRQIELSRVNLELEEAKKQLFLQNEELENRVEERTADLKDSLQQMERFCYSIAHDLKAPLRAINGWTLILKEDYAPLFDDAGKGCTNRIMEAATRMDALIRDLLVYGRLTHIDVSVASVNLNDEINNVLKDLRGEIFNRKATIEVQENLPNVLASSVLLRQVLCNLIENALKFVKPDVAPCVKIWTEILTLKPTEDGTIQPFTRLWIKDNGIGIPDSHRQRIFKVFERLHNDNSMYLGTGIGLALVQKAIERMDGKVGVEPAPGEGSLFWIELPNG